MAYGKNTGTRISSIFRYENPRRRCMISGTNENPLQYKLHAAGANAVAEIHLHGRIIAMIQHPDLFLYATHD
jgi:hypothetical protein